MLPTWIEYNVRCSPPVGLSLPVQLSQGGAPLFPSWGERGPIHCAWKEPQSPQEGGA